MTEKIKESEKAAQDYKSAAAHTAKVQPARHVSSEPVEPPPMQTIYVGAKKYSAPVTVKLSDFLKKLREAK